MELYQEWPDTWLSVIRCIWRDPFQILRRFETRDYPSEVGVEIGENLGILEQIAWRDRIHSQPITERNVMFINALDIFHLLATCVPCTAGNAYNVDDAELQWWEFASLETKIGVSRKATWWDLGRTGNPFLLVMNKWVGTTRNLMGQISCQFQGYWKQIIKINETVSPKLW